MVNTWIIGCGDIGRRVASLYKETRTDSIRAIVSSEKSLSLCNSLDIKASIVNLDHEFQLDKNNFSGANVFYFAPPPPEGSEDNRLRHFLEQLNASSNNIPERFVLISTTGVYGDSQGQWINEETPVNPKAERAIRRLSAETLLKAWAQKTSCDVVILRVPGIYAEDRLPIARIKQGLPIVKESEAGFTNRIHADDLAMACKAAMECGMDDLLRNDPVINVTDGNPSTMTSYFNQVADYAGFARPPQISLEEAEQVLSAGMVSYLKESRRIGNTKMLDILGLTLKYPDLNTALNN